MRGYFPQTERIIFAEHFNSDNYAQDGSGYEAERDKLRGFVFEPLRAYLDSERQRAGVGSAQIIEWFSQNGYPKYVTAMHSFSRSQWELPTPENYERLRRCFHELNHGGEYLRTEYEYLRTEYEDLRRPFAVTPDVPYTDVWTFPAVRTYPGKHVCEKPLALMEHIVAVSSRPGDVVLDAFMGSGNAGVACQLQKRQFVGIDISPHWCDVARQRIERSAGQFPEKKGRGDDLAGLPMFAGMDAA